MRRAQLIGLALAVALLAWLVPADPAHSAGGDPLLPQQWALARIAAQTAWERSLGAGIVVAVVDTGVSPTHLDLKTNLLPGYDFVSGDADPRDDEGHGTQVAGIIAAVVDNGIGVAGVCPRCRILPVKVLTNRGTAADAGAIAAGVRYATSHGARVINLSLGSTADTPELRAAVAEALAAGALVVAAAGYGPSPSYPAAYDGVLAVAGTTRADTPLPGGAAGGYIGLSAPGEAVLTTSWVRLRGDGYDPLDGTSAAAPHVSGAAALLLALRPELSPAQLAEVLELAADDVAAPGRDYATGYGRLNVARALELAADPALLHRGVLEVELAGVAGPVTVTLDGGATAQTDAAGVARFDGLAAGRYTVRVSSGGRELAASALLTGTALKAVRLRLDFADERARAFRPVPGGGRDSIFFPQTGHTLSGELRRFWETNGALAVFGYPLSEPFVERGEDGQGYTVQYFERHRLELHPEHARPYTVLLARAGALGLAARGREWQREPSETPQPGCVFFAATGRNLCEPFLSAWQASGLELDGQPGKQAAESLALFGLPLTSARLEPLPDGSTRLVQWFERARFEDHGVDGVLFGLLGAELAGGTNPAP